MNSFEQQILDVIQDAFPLAERPYAVLAEKIGSDETTVFDAVEKMRASGVIRRIGGVYDSKKLGFISRLCAGKVLTSSLDFSAEPHAQTAMENFATVVMSEPSITHNYIRSHEYNVWFTVIAENESEILKIVDKLCAATDLHDVHVMSATRKFKINTVMKGASAPVDCRQLAVGRNSDERGTERHSDNLVILEAKRRGTIISRVDAWLEDSSEFRKTAVDLSESDKSRIRTSCEDIPHSLTPFKDWGVSCEELREDIDAKRMRRFGAILRHQDAGFAFNAMVCFRIVDSRKSEVGRGSNVILSGEATKDPVKSCDLIAQAGSLLASNPHISHCYERPSFEGFPYNVYAMMHANSAELLDQYVIDCVKSLSALQSTPVDYVVLHSVRELKKTSFKFFA